MSSFIGHGAFFSFFSLFFSSVSTFIVSVQLFLASAKKMHLDDKKSHIRKKKEKKHLWPINSDIKTPAKIFLEKEFLLLKIFKKIYWKKNSLKNIFFKFFWIWKKNHQKTFVSKNESFSTIYSHLYLFFVSEYKEILWTSLMARDWMF